MKLKKIIGLTMSLVMTITNCNICFSKDDVIQGNIDISEMTADTFQIDDKISGQAIDLKNEENDGISLADLEENMPEAGANGFIAEISEPDPNATVITTPEELANIQDGGNYVLGNDIDLSTYNGGVWIPINVGYVGCTLDGQGHKIINLSIPESSNVECAGLFGEINGKTTIKNVGVEVKEGSNIFGIERAGGLVCFGHYFRIENCYNSGDVISGSTSSDSSCSGGLVGGGYGIRIENSYNSGNVISSSTSSGDSCSGGLVGGFGFGSFALIIKNSYNSGDVISSSTSSSSFSGGLVGSCYDYVRIENCYNSGEVTINYNSSSTSSSSGGLIGSGYDVTIENSYSYGEINATDKTAYRGGIIGYCRNLQINGKYYYADGDGVCGNEDVEITYGSASDADLYRISEEENVLAINDTMTISAGSKGDNSLDVSWSSSEAGIIDISNSSKSSSDDGYIYSVDIKGLKEGSTVLTASAGDGNSVSYTITVGNAVLYRVSEKDNSIELNDSITLAAASKSDKALNVSWSSSDSNIVKIDSSGGALNTYFAKITAIDKGNAVVTAKAGNGSSVSFNIEVKNDALYCVSEKEVNIGVGEKVTLTAGSKTEKPLSVNWKSSKDGIVTTNSLSPASGSQYDYHYDGTFTGNKEGKTDITVTADNGSSVKFTVYVGTLYPVSKEEISKYDGDNQNKAVLEAGSKTPELLDVKWESSDSSIVEIENVNNVQESNGNCRYKANIICKKHGEADVTAKTENGNKVTFKVKVDCVLPKYIEEYNAAVAEYEALTAEKIEEVQAEVEESDEQLRENMKPIIENKMLSIVCSDSEKEAVVNVVYDFLNQKMKKEMGFKNIDINKETVKNIVQEVYNCLNEETYTGIYNGYTVKIHTTGYGAAFTGKVTINNKEIPNALVSDNVTKVMEEYVSQLQQLSQKALETSIISAIDYFGNTLGINKYLDNKLNTKIKEFIDKINAELKKLNINIYDFDKVYDFIQDCKTMYSCIAKIDVKNMDGCYNYIKSLSNISKVSQNQTISNEIQKRAHNKVMSARNDVIKAAIDYVYGMPVSDDNEVISFIKKFNIMCPVDVIVKDSNGNEIGSVIGNTIMCSSDIIDIEKKGDMKIIYLLKQEDIEIKLNARDYGDLNVSIEDYIDNEKSSQSNFYNIPLSTNKELVIKSPYGIENNSFIVSGDNVYPPDEYYASGDVESITINVTAENGKISGAGIYDKGSPVSLIAMPDDGYKFIGWYDGVGKLLDYSVLYRFTAKESVNFTAKFTEITYKSDDDTENSSAAVIETNTESITNEIIPSNPGDETNTEITTVSGSNAATIVTTESVQATTTVKHSSGNSGGGKSSGNAVKSMENSTENVTEATTESRVISNDVKVTIGSKSVVIGDKSYDMDVAPYIQASSNSTLVPLRFISLAICGGDIEKADTSKIIAWDGNTKTATITANNKVIKFTAGSEFMIVDDKTMVMDNDVKAEIKDGRMFIPFRALGKALGVDVDWDTDTKTAVYKTK